MDSSVEEATMTLLKSKKNVVLVRESSSEPAALATFDYSDLNAYLLVVVGLSKPEAHQVELYNNIMLNAREGNNISMRKIQALCRQEPLVAVPSNGNLAQAIEILGSGIHRLLVTNALGNVVGIMSQLLMVDFFWNEGVNFPAVDRLYPVMLRDLGFGCSAFGSSAPHAQ
ncbi:CBS domain containing protein [Metarhizium album ARSEF 1941]|uniref:CBS domain containing protein n=1 Tax=Metarhizium album (strain ARSEF 1941) TaxID=1081103 RepID=A0A0B2X460_METAS|nr:CBS domain containing protein [Metarhizium album ARSEF 1941]KHO01139.1 CBS domain containing protein [Metarhizium album ARSEF 1941]